MEILREGRKCGRGDCVMSAWVCVGLRGPACVLPVCAVPCEREQVGAMRRDDAEPMATQCLSARISECQGKGMTPAGTTSERRKMTAGG